LTIVSLPPTWIVLPLLAPSLQPVEIVNNEQIRVGSHDEFLAIDSNSFAFLAGE
jgi:hypothetical protein